MNKILKLALVLSTAAVLSACAKKEPEPLAVTPEPVYTDKWGNVVEDS